MDLVSHSAPVQINPLTKAEVRDSAVCGPHANFSAVLHASQKCKKERTFLEMRTRGCLSLCEFFCGSTSSCISA